MTREKNAKVTNARLTLRLAAKGQIRPWCAIGIDGSFTPR